MMRTRPWVSSAGASGILPLSSASSARFSASCRAATPPWYIQSKRSSRLQTCGNVVEFPMHPYTSPVLTSPTVPIFKKSLAGSMIVQHENQCCVLFNYHRQPVIITILFDAGTLCNALQLLSLSLLLELLAKLFQALGLCCSFLLLFPFDL